MKPDTISVTISGITDLPISSSWLNILVCYTISLTVTDVNNNKNKNNNLQQQQIIIDVNIRKATNVSDNVKCKHTPLGALKTNMGAMA